MVEEGKVPDNELVQHGPTSDVPSCEDSDDQCPRIVIGAIPVVPVWYVVCGMLQDTGFIREPLEVIQVDFGQRGHDVALGTGLKSHARLLLAFLPHLCENFDVPTSHLTPNRGP
jgi:hypothetical protein